MLGRGEADVAAIDCVTYGLLQRHRPRAVAELRIIDHTQPVPGPPYVTSVATPPEVATALRDALRTVIATLAPDVHAALGVCGVSTLALDDYEPIVALARWADVHGYRELGASHQVRAQRQRTPIADHPKHPAKNL